MDIPEVRIQFIVRGDDDFDVEKLGVLTNTVPDKTWRSGDSIQGTKLQHKENGWALETNTIATWDAGKLVEDFFLDRISDVADAVVSARSATQFDAIELRVLITASEGVPAISFSNSLLSDLQSIEAGVDVDIVLT